MINTLLRVVLKAFVQRKHKDFCYPSEKHKENHLVVLSKRLVASKKTCHDFCFSLFLFSFFKLWTVPMFQPQPRSLLAGDLFISPLHISRGISVTMPPFSCCHSCVAAYRACSSLQQTALRGTDAHAQT